METPALVTRPATRNLSWNGKRLPVVSGIVLQVNHWHVLKCCGLYNVPFRRFQGLSGIFSNKSITLESFGNISTLVGFVGSISYYPSVQLFRLFLVSLFDKDLIIIYAISNGFVKCVHPEYGPLNLTLSQFLYDEPGASILCMSPVRDSQQRKLNLAWFLPQIKKYRKSLLEVFLASLVLQLLNLAQPLVLQQIFDKVIASKTLILFIRSVYLTCKPFQGLIGAVALIFLLILPIVLISH